MPDVLQPVDEFDLIQGHWPPESESDYATESTSWTSYSETYEHAAGSANTAAGQAASDWLGQSGATYVEQMRGHMSSLNKDATEAAYISTQLKEAGNEIAATKTDIANVVESFTPKIQAAKDAEAAGKKPPAGEGSATLTTNARKLIADTADALNTQLDTTGKNLERGAAPAERGPGPVHQTAYGNLTPDESRKALGQQGQPAGPPGTNPKQLPQTPAAKTPGSATPSPSTPGTPGPSAPSAPSMPSAPGSGGGSPASGSPTSGGGSPAGAPSAPTSGSPGGGGSPSGGQGGNSQNNNNNQNQSGTPSGGGDPLLAAIDQQFGPAPMTQLSGVTQAIPSTISQVTSAAAAPAPQPGPESVGMPSAAPMGTGVTPGIPGGPAVQPATMPPTTGTPAPAVGGEAAPGSTVTNATMSKSAKMIPLESPPVSGGTQLSGASGAADRRPAGFGMAGPGGGINGGWVSAAAGAAAGAGGLSDTADMPTGGFKTFLADLGAAERIAHRALASIRQQFERAGWIGDQLAQPLAVGVYRREGVRGTSFHAVWATADGISLWPYGVKLPAGVHPVGMVDGIDAVQATKMIGYADPRQKIGAIMPETYGELVCVLDTVDQDTARYGQIVSAGEAFSATQSRGDYAKVPAEAAEAAVTNTIMKYEMRECAAHLDRLQEEMIRHRWDREIPAHGVEAATGMWQVAEAKRCLDLGMLSDAGYAIGQVQKT